MGLRLELDEPGLIGIASATLGRYREFDITLRDVIKPPGTAISWETTLDLACNYNSFCRQLMENERLKWLWILGDDHVLKPDILLRLLKHNVDIVAPLCLQRSHPFRPVIYELRDKKHWQIDWEYLKGKKGLIQVDACGNAGMLIRRNVIEDMNGDWHRMGWLDKERGSSDLYFCKRAGELDYKLNIDLDSTIGHLTHMAVWPVRDLNREYSVGIREGMDLGK